MVALYLLAMSPFSAGRWDREGWLSQLENCRVPSRALGRDRLRPILGQLDFGQWGIFFDSGQKQISWRFVRLGPTSSPPPPISEGRCPEGWSPNLEKVGSRRVGPRRVEAQNFALFFSPLPPPFRSFCVSLWVSSRGIFVLFEAPGPECTFGVLGSSYETPPAPKPPTETEKERNFG